MVLPAQSYGEWRKCLRDFGGGSVRLEACCPAIILSSVRLKASRSGAVRIDGFLGSIDYSHLVLGKSVVSN